MPPFKLSSIDRDTSIQCRASIDMVVVGDYAAAMEEGAEFPPVVLFGTKDKAWIGDGWHRIMAAQALEHISINADLRPGGRNDALKHALGANAVHGHRRSNADKRRAVEIAVREFQGLSSRAIAQLCGVSNKFVSSMREEAGVNGSHLTGLDGKQYPATRPRIADEEPEPFVMAEEDEGQTEAPTDGAEPHSNDDEPDDDNRWDDNRWDGVIRPPSMGMQYAWAAVRHLEKIEPNDTDRRKAFDYVKEWISDHENAKA